MAVDFLKSLDVAELTDVGLVRERNEDTSKILIPPPGISQTNLGALFMVVDGMGGLGGGDVASKYAAAEIARYYYTEPTTETDVKTRLEKALQAASDIVGEQAPKLGLARIGATAAGILINQAGDVLAFNVGDCRVYRIRDGKIERISRDQSVMERQIEAGLSPERAAQMTRSSAVTAFLGQPVPLQANIAQDHAQPGDTYVICSDGLWSLVRPEQIAEIVQKNNAQGAARKLISMALQAGGQDNVTSVIVRVTKPRRAAAVLVPLAAALLVAVVLIMGYLALRSKPPSGGTVAQASTGDSTNISAVALGTAAATESTTNEATNEATNVAVQATSTLAASQMVPTVTPDPEPLHVVADSPTATAGTTATEAAPGTTYRIIGSTPVDALNCEYATCISLEKLQPGTIIMVLDTVQGGPLAGHDGVKWYKIKYGNTLFAYVHSSYAESTTSTPALTPTSAREIF